MIGRGWLRPTAPRARGSSASADRTWAISWPAASRATRCSSGLRRGCSRIARMRAPVWLLLLIAALVSATACGPTVDLTKGLEVKILNSGWYDLGIVNGQNKL